MTSRPVRGEPVPDALPPRTHFDSERWLNSRQPAGKGVWIKRGGAVLVTGLLAALGWVGYQQLPAGESDAGIDDETLVLEGGAATEVESELAFSPSAEASPFETPQTFRGMSPRVTAAVSEPEPDPSANPFAAFAPKQAAMEESRVAEPAPRITPAARGGTADVTLASNEAPAPASAVEIFEVGGQSEPEAVEMTPPAPTSPAAGAMDDPFAAFAAQPAVAVEQVSSAPPPFGGRPQPEPAASDAEWGTAPATVVTPAQFQPEHAELAAPAQFEPQARPIEESNSFAAEPAPALNHAPGTGDWSGFDAQPVAVEPAPMTRRARIEPVYSPAVEPAQSTSFHVPQPAAPANDPRDEELHVVQHGETYWSIARQHYGAGRYFQALADYNKPRISDQASLKPGMKVLVPSAETLDARYGKVMQASGLARPPAKPQSGLRVDPQGRPLYVVGEGDTLGEISRRYLGKTTRSDEIFRMNQEQLPNPNRLKAGMILVMPEDAAEVHPATSIPSRR